MLSMELILQMFPVHYPALTVVSTDALSEDRRLQALMGALVYYLLAAAHNKPLEHAVTNSGQNRSPKRLIN